MFNKQQFLALFKNSTELDIIKLFNTYEKACSRGITLFTDEFYTPAIWKALSKISSKDFEVDSYGIFEDGERRVIAFNKSEWDYYPIVILEIKCDTRFSKLEHKDYLGAIMSLNIKREKMGDMIVKDDGTCYLVAYEKIANYIKDNLHKVKNLSCHCNILDNICDIPVIEYKEEIINVSSRRLDSIVSELSNMSRSKAVDIINKGLVLVDYQVIADKSYDVDDDARITIRKIGKFKVKETLSTTKSGRLKITVLKYI